MRDGWQFSVPFSYYTRLYYTTQKPRSGKGFLEKKKKPRIFWFFFLNFNKKEMSRVCVAQSCFGPVWRGFLFFFFPAFSIPLLAVILDPSPEFKNHLQPFHIWCNFTFTLWRIISNNHTTHHNWVAINWPWFLPSPSCRGIVVYKVYLLYQVIYR